jgi:hypothetical protein
MIMPVSLEKLGNPARMGFGRILACQDGIHGGHDCMLLLIDGICSGS